MSIPPSQPLSFSNGSIAKNRFMLSPLTNTQSHPDGTLSDTEYNWLTMRAAGGFGMVMTCASHVQQIGKGFPGQLGIYGDQHLKGHRRLAAGIQAHGSLAMIQLHHAGMRSPAELIGQQAVSASDQPKYHARALSLEEVHQLRKDFVEAAVRAQKAGYDGVEVHGAHGYILTQFLSPSINQRKDDYGGSLENRTRLIIEIIEQIRERCGKAFLLGLRLSPERFGMVLAEVIELAQRLIDQRLVHFLDFSLWDVYKQAEQPEADKLLLDYLTELDRGEVRLTVSGKIQHGTDVQHILDAGVDFVTVGRSGILHHDFPKKVIAQPTFQSVELPVSEQYLSNEGIGAPFIDYLKKRPGFVA